MSRSARRSRKRSPAAPAAGQLEAEGEQQLPAHLVELLLESGLAQEIGQLTRRKTGVSASRRVIASVRYAITNPDQVDPLHQVNPPLSELRNAVSEFVKQARACLLEETVGGPAAG
ncbi:MULTISPECIES: hypothetical protein [unclassified Streptomyces]|uniref:hypothetical protein n=1 Tax=unclassified Streptomyces TaxID=2593676 RepID=UPI002E8132EA|nr:hypothetical protein [Streptomyces sp. NBC_00589]WTI42342.1 hypothetical protein OIC96_49325 [Streptomyces sp. NBC_00775]WUB23976.1 hypothetical protein OHA51_00405 [Streptomyces sp. NBC_00589]